MKNSPPEIQAQNNSEASIERLLAVATMSHKYSLSSFEAWALGVIWIHSRSKRDYLNTCPRDMLSGIHQAATAGGHKDLCGLVEQKWLSRVKRRELQLRHALDFGETHGMALFLACGYYQQARSLKSPTLGAGSEVADFSHLNLTHAQLHRLLAGYCTLSLFWETCITSTCPRSCPPKPISMRSHVTHKSTMDDIVLRDASDPLNILGGLEAACDRAKGDQCSCRREYIDKLMSGFSILNHFP
jgi:hypothetical protein